MKTSFKARLMASPSYADVLILSIFTVLITLQPYFIHGKINIFETGLYLPGIQSILNGEVPFRDFFHLRGPFELYMPAFLMKLFGVHLKVLYSYFYFGNVLCLILCILIAKELFESRLVLYLMAPALIGRTFPRVVFAYWGGMRYASGLLALWFVIKFFKTNKSRWMFGAGIVSAVAGFTSIEMGAYPFMGIMAAMTISGIFKLQHGRLIFNGLKKYFTGLALVGIPFAVYLFVSGALVPYVDSVWTIVTRMQKVIDPHFVSVYPRNFPEAFAAMVNPLHINFKHMTPSYLYMILLVYLLLRMVMRRLFWRDLAIICIGIYGFVMYNTGFRGIWAAQFEMALQPEKILLFLLFDILLLKAVENKNKLKTELALREQPHARWNDPSRLKIYGINALLFFFICSSIGYSIQRYNRRFFAFKFARDKVFGKDTEYLKPKANGEMRALNMERAKGILVPVEQADELEQVVAYLRSHAEEKEQVFTYPDFGTYNFLADRRAFGRFPLATFAWFNDRWHQDFLLKFKSSKPRYVILQKEIPQYWKDVYLALEPNREKFQEVMDMISSDYRIEAQTPLSYVYRLK
ncbi:MAG: hypothetical protein JW847_06880 [Candidatus Omnitrophica bacterium]|nr:hypothetical protein [Candidatus Omnitrophota bacterium]